MQWNTRALVSGLVAAVVVMAVATVWMSTRPAAEEARIRPETPIATDVVRAPPIGVPDTAVAGGPPSPAAAKAKDCPGCGIVESVRTKENHSRFEMQIRMGDGSVKTVEQATPLVAGSRVVVQGKVARPAPVATQG